MSQFNPMLKNTERSSYELAYLLRNLPRHLTSQPLTAEQKQMTVAAERQASNYHDVLAHGVEAIGRLMWTASGNKASEIDARDVGRLGVLISELAVQLQFLDEFRGSVQNYREQQKGHAE